MLSLQIHEVKRWGAIQGQPSTQEHLGKVQQARVSLENRSLLCTGLLSPPYEGHGDRIKGDGEE